jgi:hypothetical protein
MLLSKPPQLSRRHATGSRLSSAGRAASGRSRRLVRAVALAALSGAGMFGSSVTGCSASDPSRSSARVGVDDEQENDLFFEQEGGEPNPMNGNGGFNGFVDGETPMTGRIEIDETCVIEEDQAELVEQPVDVILVLDNSGSMDDELQAVEENINVSFASILIESQVDYRVILISRHREEPRESSESASTSICVTTPLSNLSACPTEDGPVSSVEDGPVFSERFFQYSTKVESDDSFDVALESYFGELEDAYDKAPGGWSEWLRPGAKKVFLELTDDDEDMSATEFVSELVNLAPEHFGADAQNPSFVFHSIVGLAEKDPPTAAYLADEPLQEGECTGNDGDVTSPGVTYQELSRMTGGLRFPLCQYDAYDVVFRRIAEDVVQTSTLACDFAIPPAPLGLELDLNNVAIEYTPGTGAPPIQFGQAPASGACQADAFYIANDRINLCPEACSTVRRDPTANVAVLFTCESQLIVPR